MGMLFDKPEVSRVTDQDWAVLQTKQQRDTLKGYQQQVEKLLEKERELAKKFQNLYNSFVLHNIFQLKNEKPKLFDNNNNAQFIEHSQTGEPCRSCTDFRTFSRMRRQEFSESHVQSLQSKKDSNVENKNHENHRKDCPLDKDELGRSTWNLLHTIAATYSDKPSVEEQNNIQQFIRLLPKVYPCETCANDFAEILIYHPPNISSQKSISLWMCEVHNMVNKKLEKPLFDCSKVNERWRDGWADGHCD